MDTGRNLSLLFGAADSPSDLSERITVVVDKAGQIAKIYNNVNARTHGKDLVDFFKGM